VEALGLAEHFDHQAQDRIAAGSQMKLFADAGTSLRSESKSEHLQRLLEPDRPLGIGQHQQRKPFRKDLAPTGLFEAKEATDFYQQMNGSCAAGKVV
jgi:hypothetical protein